MRSLLISTAALLAAACASGAPAPELASGPVAAEPAPLVPVKFETYSAKQFYGTVNYNLAAGRGRCFSPDGQTLLISSDETGIINTYAMGLDGTMTALTASETDSTFAESYFPAGDRVLVEADGGDELHHLFVRSADGTLTDLTPGEKTRATFLGWNANGETFYVASNARDASTDDVYAYSAADFSSRMIYQNDGLELGGISPDGKLLALVENVSSADANIYIYDLSAEKAEKKLITPHEDNIAYTT